MKGLGRWMAAVTVCAALFGAGVGAGAESFVPDSGTCFGATSCACGYVCVTGYCAYRGPVTECGTDRDCRPECGDRVCVDRRCVARSSLDSGVSMLDDATAGLRPPTDRPESNEDRVADVVVRDDGNAEAPWDRPPASLDVSAPPPVDAPPTVRDAGSTAEDVTFVEESMTPETTGTLVQGCGCTVAGATTSRPYWVLGLFAWGLRRRRPALRRPRCPAP